MRWAEHDRQFRAPFSREEKILLAAAIAATVSVVVLLLSGAWMVP